MLPLYDITKFTLLDYPDKPAAIMWFAGCNMRCLYCYNPDIVLCEGRISTDAALRMLTNRIGFLEGVVLSGGEATIYPDIVNFCKSIKALGFAIKLDTNGMRPDVLRDLLQQNLLDYVALDYKAPENKLAAICGGGSLKRFWEAFEVLKLCGIAFEVRTTLHADLLSDEEIVAMSKELAQRGYERSLYVQIFRNAPKTLGNMQKPIRLVDVQYLSSFVTIRDSFDLGQNF